MSENFKKNGVNYLVELSAIDNLVSTLYFRFKLVYIFRKRINMKILLYNSERLITSLSQIYHGSIAGEREIYDMFGIWFSKHPDFRRILTDYGFKGYPLRKDFPLSGFEEIQRLSPYGTINYAQIKLAQAYRMI